VCGKLLELVFGFRRTREFEREKKKRRVSPAMGEGESGELYCSLVC